ncbi:MAG: translation initiation factor IF-2 [Candidatus Nanohaloarchaeota archaeon QJJ-9]|nr:translation initiation factor IF-2 [Candidatus Nanohaloarchaeota archaeon QJJ-9]
MYRQPIVSVLGHVDSGKTTLLDFIRGSLVVQKESGSITQMIGATEVPLEKVEEICGGLLDQLDTELKLPGILFIDTPGHAAFTSLRKRGGSLSDIAVVMVDVNDGIEPQTREAIEILQETNTPFVIALNKIDKMPGWKTEDRCWTRNFQNQKEKLRNRLDEKIYEIMGDLSDLGITCDRFDRVDNFQKKVAIVPTSAETGEGIPELLMVLTGLSQRYLGDRLEVEKGTGKATVLEVNEVKGFGTTIDVILYDGTIEKEDKLIIQEKDGIVETEIKALLRSKPLKEIRREKKFEEIEEATPASGVKIAAKELEKVIAGATVRAAGNEEEVEEGRKDIEEKMQEFKIETQKEGVVVKADSLGSLEAVYKHFKEAEIPISKAEVGKITKQDFLELEGFEDEHKAVFGFNTGITEDADDVGGEKEEIKVFQSDIIYELVDRYEEWREEIERRKREEKLKDISRPGKFRILPEHVFRSSNPVVVGVEVVEGALSPGSKYMTKEGEELGRIKSIQDEGESIDIARKGDEVAVSLTGVQMGRQIEKGQTLLTDIAGEDYRIIKKMEEYISQDELNALEKIVEIKDQKNPRWKLS